MSVYYNENDPSAAQWLKRLVQEGHLPEGDVDERSIEDVEPGDLDGYTQHHFFAGIGGWPLALRWAGWPEDQPVWTGSCPCQPFSSAGGRGGADDPRHLWPVWRWIIRQWRPPIVFGEQVASKLGRGWLKGVQTDLQAMGYDTAGADLCAASVGAPHVRQRLWWVAHSERDEQRRKESCSWPTGRVGWIEQSVSWDEPWQGALSRLRTLDDGLPRRVVACDAARNAIVPQLAQVFIESALEAEILRTI